MPLLQLWSSDLNLVSGLDANSSMEGHSEPISDRCQATTSVFNRGKRDLSRKKATAAREIGDKKALIGNLRTSTPRYRLPNQTNLPSPPYPFPRRSASSAVSKTRRSQVAADVGERFGKGLGAPSPHVLQALIYSLQDAGSSASLAGGADARRQ